MAIALWHYEPGTGVFTHFDLQINFGGTCLMRFGQGQPHQRNISMIGTHKDKFFLTLVLTLSTDKPLKVCNS